MRFLRHLRKLLADLFGFTRQNKAWWIVPLVLLLLLVGYSFGSWVCANVAAENAGLRSLILVAALFIAARLAASGMGFSWMA